MATGSPPEIRSSAPRPWRGAAAPGAGTSPAARRPAAPALSERDRELLALLARGRSTGQIAAATGVTTNTVRTRIRRVQHKLAVDSRDQAARLAGGLGIA